MPSKAKKHDHTAVVGLNVDDDDVRYEPGDPVAVEHVEQWMIDDGTVDCAGGCHQRAVSAAVSAPETSDPAETSESAPETGADAQIDAEDVSDAVAEAAPDESAEAPSDDEGEG